MSALANSKGGVLLIGSQTKRNPTHFGDEVTSTSPFAQDLVNLDQMRQVVRDWVYPPIPGLEIAWYPCASDPSRGIVAILIPVEACKERPYIVTKVVDANERVAGTLMGYYERVSAGVSITSPPRLRDTLKDGMRFGELDQRLQGV